MNRVTWAWLAGFTDGDGCIYIPPNAMQRPSQIKTMWYQSAKSTEVLDSIAEFLTDNGFEVRWYLHKGSAKKHAVGGEVWHLRVQGAAQNERLLEELEPFLVLKHMKALTALEILAVAPRGRHIQHVERVG